MGNRYINKRSIYAMMQKLAYKCFEYISTPLDEILNTQDDSDHGYFIVFDINYNNSCKDKTEQLSLIPNKNI